MKSVESQNTHFDGGRESASLLFPIFLPFIFLPVQIAAGARSELGEVETHLAWRGLDEFGL